MNAFKPSESNNHSADSGMSPKIGYADRAQPNTRPAKQHAAARAQSDRDAVDHQFEQPKQCRR